jgi:hypothetical protein
MATTPTAQRVYISTFLFAVTSAVLLIVAATAYPIFYYTYVPKKVVSIPIHLQYKYVYTRIYGLVCTCPKKSVHMLNYTIVLA